MAAPAVRRAPDALSRAPLLAAAGLLLLVLGLVWLGGPAAPPPVETERPVLLRDLRFEDRADGAVVVSEDGGGVLAVLPPGEEGFVRGALRALTRERRLTEAGREPPFRLAAWPDGRLTLEDRATGRVLDLRAFGATNAGSFARLLDQTREGPR